MKAHLIKPITLSVLLAASSAFAASPMLGAPSSLAIDNGLFGSNNNPTVEASYPGTYNLVGQFADENNGAANGLLAAIYGEKTTSGNYSGMSIPAQGLLSVVGSGAGLPDNTTDLTDAIKSVDSDVLSNTTNIANAKTEVTSLQTGLNTANSQISTLETGLNTANGQITALQTQANTTLPGDMNTLQTALNTANSQISTLSTQANTTLPNEMSALQTQVNDNSASIAQIAPANIVYYVANQSQFVNAMTAVSNHASQTPTVVHLAPGTYTLSAATTLNPNVTLEGSGSQDNPNTIIDGSLGLSTGDNVIGMEVLVPSSATAIQISAGPINISNSVISSNGAGVVGIEVKATNTPNANSPIQLTLNDSAINTAGNNSSSVSIGSDTYVNLNLVNNTTITGGSGSQGYGLVFSNGTYGAIDNVNINNSTLNDAGIQALDFNAWASNNGNGNIGHFIVQSSNINGDILFTRGSGDIVPSSNSAGSYVIENSNIQFNNAIEFTAIGTVKLEHDDITGPGMTIPSNDPNDNNVISLNSDPNNDDTYPMVIMNSTINNVGTLITWNENGSQYPSNTWIMSSMINVGQVRNAGAHNNSLKVMSSLFPGTSGSNADCYSDWTLGGGGVPNCN